jgi:hypothetical protein
MHTLPHAGRSDGEDAASAFIVRLPIVAAQAADPVEVRPLPFPVAGPA